ncbi:hypothetical protein MA16_Dca003716 [Dendrobium catenatum]|uniref:Uncharacterized protein n=1 Tax=Dendrobium catenatum TaxID=906689 RepID=A0A2I0WFS9_9ASPA|nr:hypothetical protein MA16_Dca003716 [Dendrobium catenatum]
MYRRNFCPLVIKENNVISPKKIIFTEGKGKGIGQDLDCDTPCKVKRPDVSPIKLLIQMLLHQNFWARRWGIMTRRWGIMQSFDLFKILVAI